VKFLKNVPEDNEPLTNTILSTQPQAASHADEHLSLPLTADKEIVKVFLHCQYQK
jgi:hypothetical protein